MNESNNCIILHCYDNDKKKNVKTSTPSHGKHFVDPSIMHCARNMPISQLTYL